MTNKTVDNLTEIYRQYGCLTMIVFLVAGLAVLLLAIAGVLSLLVWLLGFIGVHLAVGFGKLLIVAAVLLLIRWLWTVLFK